MSHRRYELTEREWSIIAPLLPRADSVFGHGQSSQGLRMVAPVG